MTLPKNFFEEEIRSGYRVTSLTKKIWATELSLLEKFDQVCQTYNLRYYIDYGTLLGAVRHKGFIPWDDDIDVTMFRNDYEQLKEIAPSVFTPPLFFQNSYTDVPVYAFSKLRDSRTTAIEFSDAPSCFNQGIFIDIFPLDDAPDNIHVKSSISAVQRELYLIFNQPAYIKQQLAQGTAFVLEPHFILELLNLSKRDRLQLLENFNSTHFGKSSKVNYMVDEIFNHSSSMSKSWYANVVYLPFEGGSYPAPSKYDLILKAHYGDYMVPIINNNGHDIFFDPDNPYRNYMSS